MSSVKPTYLIALLLVIAFAVYSKVSNPNRKYSTSDFWSNATVESVAEVPEQALLAGNSNGPVIMWAAIGADDPKILRALVARGADVNEYDGIFQGTPLAGAAGYTNNPAMIIELVRLGARINQTVHNRETALMIAAQYNQNPGIITALVKLGAKPKQKSFNGKSALDFAKAENNETAIQELQSVGG